MEEMEVWQPPSKHLDDGPILPTCRLTILPQVVLTQFVAPKHSLSLEDCTANSSIFSWAISYKKCNINTLWELLTRAVNSPRGPIPYLKIRNHACQILLSQILTF